VKIGALIPVIDSDKSGIARSGNAPALTPVIDSLEARQEIAFEKSGNF
jgi:hypothetical protein